MRELKSNDEGSFITYRTPPYKVLKHKNDEGSLHSMNAPASVLGGLQDGKPLALSFR
jgi:hypothetical protein